MSAVGILSRMRRHNRRYQRGWSIWSEVLPTASAVISCRRSLRSFATPRTDRLGGPIRWTMTCPAAERVWAANRPLSALLHNFKTVGSQFQNYGLGNVRALLRLNPLVIQILAALAFGVSDKGFVDSANNHVFRCCGRHFPPPALSQAYHSGGAAQLRRISRQTFPH